MTQPLTLDEIEARITGETPIGQPTKRRKPSVELIEGDCREALKDFEDNSVDAVVTDPPYGLEFMGKAWDYDVPSIDVWREVYRVLKPGGHLLSFFGSRTYHRGVIPIEDAGFEIRDQIMWLYGSGFPKSSNQDGDWEGWGTALKPAHEPIVVARKPLIGTMARNLATHGVGALNIDGCRVETTDSLGGGMVSMGRPKVSEGWDRPWMHDPVVTEAKKGESALKVAHAESLGRWPANVIHDGSDEVLDAFPAAPGQIANESRTAPSAKTSRVYGAMKRQGEPSQNDPNDGVVGFKMKPGARRLDSGSAARFFYCAKASRADRNDGLEDPGPQFKHGATLRKIENTETKGNTHPTVKPTPLMQYLCRLVTPPGGTILDPFMGSGSTGRGAVLEGFNFIGIDMSTEYVDIADARIAAAEAEYMEQ